MGNGWMKKFTDKESIISHRARYIKVTIRMASEVAMACLSSHLELATMGNGRMTTCMEKESIISLMG